MKPDMLTALLECDLFTVLGLESDKATINDINNAFKRIATVFHPDKYEEGPHKNVANAIFVAASHARDTLTNPARMKAWIDSQAAKTPITTPQPELKPEQAPEQDQSNAFKSFLGGILSSAIDTTAENLKKAGTKWIGRLDRKTKTN